MADVQLCRQVLVLDGGLGSSLEEDYDVEFSASTPLWSSHLLLSSPATLLDLQTAFVTSGADVLLTATYQASVEGFRRTPRNVLGDSSTDARHGYDDEEGAAFMRSAVAIARSAFRATGRHGLVALSLGAFGACMIPSQEYTGKYPQAMQSTISLRDFHLDRLMCFAKDPTTWDEIDLVAFETLPRLTEVQATRLAMEELRERGHKPKPFWISCVFPNEDDNLPDDSSIREVLHAMLVSDSETKDATTACAHPFAVGINCTKIHKVRTLVQHFESTASQQGLKLPRLVIYPDGAKDLVYDSSARKWITRKDSRGDMTASAESWETEMSNIVEEVIRRGAWQGVLVGGCCKTGPSQIRGLRGCLESLQLLN